MKQQTLIISALAALACIGGIWVLAGPSALPAATEKAAANVPRGRGFDFYVLSLSWSPTYCQDTRARQRDTSQCASARPFAFVVHGLWPQFERGFPRACRTTFTRPTQRDVSAMLDIMPSERLAQHEWENHGTCSGLSATDFLSVTRAARQSVIIPTQFDSAGDWRRVSAGEVENAFVIANPGMRADGISVSRRGNLLSEVRICLTLDLKPRSCDEVDNDGARDETRLSLPPSRG